MGQYNQQRKVAANGCLSNMKAKCRQSGGWTLPETVTVVAIIAVLVGLAIPSIRAINSSFQSTGAKNMISAALACARAAAAQHQRYAGVRFQRDIYGDQYIIPIIQDPDIAPFAFRAIRGRKPLRLPENRGVMEVVTSAGEIADPCSIPDKTTFSIVFSPSGKLVIHKVRVYRANPDDSVFNSYTKVESDDAMFEEDSDKNPPYKKEDSRNAFIIYDKNRFEQLYEIGSDTAWLRYLQHLLPVYINPYTGTIIESNNEQ